MGQDKGSLIKQKQRLCMEEKENKRFILYFPLGRRCPATCQEAELQYV